MPILSNWLESIGQDPRTIFKDVAVFIVRYCVLTILVLLPIIVLQLILQPYAPAIRASLQKPFTPATPHFWLIFVPFFLYIFWTVCILISLLSCWRTLAARFPAPKNFREGQLSKRQSARVGVANYNNILTIGVSPAGLYLACIFPFRLMHSPILIPWQQVKAVRQKRFLRRTTTFLTIGSPKIATISLINPKLLEAAAPWLPQDTPPSNVAGPAH